MATVVRKKPGESEDKLISKFRKKIQFDQLLIELKEREYYKSGAEKKQERLKIKRRKTKGKRRARRRGK